MLKVRIFCIGTSMVLSIILHLLGGNPRFYTNLSKTTSIHGDEIGLAFLISSLAVAALINVGLRVWISFIKRQMAVQELDEEERVHFSKAAAFSTFFFLVFGCVLATMLYIVPKMGVNAYFLLVGFMLLILCVLVPVIFIVSHKRQRRFLRDYFETNLQTLQDSIRALRRSHKVFPH